MFVRLQLDDKVVIVNTAHVMHIEPDEIHEDLTNVHFVTGVPLALSMTVDEAAAGLAIGRPTTPHVERFVQPDERPAQMGFPTIRARR